MKKKRILAALLLLSLCFLLLTACGGTGGAADGTAAEKEALAARVAELEATLQAEREATYIEKSSLQERIKALEDELALLTGGATAPEDEGTGKMVFHYTVVDGKATVTKYEGTAALVEIPAVLNGYPVARIGERAFEGNTYLSAVVVPEGVVAIDWFAFYNCAALFDVTLPQSVTEIGHAVFDGCAAPTLVCPKGSYAAEFAKSYGLSLLER